MSPATFTVTVWLVWPVAKLTVPPGRAPPSKSAALNGAAPLPVTANLALWDTEVSPLRVTVKVSAVLPDWPSALLAARA